MEYKEMPYHELKKLCSERGISAIGKKEILVNRLVADDYELEVPKDETPKVDKSKYKGMKPTDPNPDNPNYDLAGRWIRRDPNAWR